MGTLSGTNPRSFDDYVKKLRKATSKEDSDKIDYIFNSLDELTDLIKRNDIKTTYLLSLGLEKENITQDRFDELMKLLKSYGKQKGFKV